jgi:ABC-type nitrate/sulfonate/bicarbonate transport system permease component
MYVAVAGLGHLVQVYSSATRPAELIVLVMLFALFGVLAVNVVRAIEERLGGWRQSLEA